LLRNSIFAGGYEIQFENENSIRKFIKYSKDFWLEKFNLLNIQKPYSSSYLNKQKPNETKPNRTKANQTNKTKTWKFEKKGKVEWKWGGRGKFLES